MSNPQHISDRHRLERGQSFIEASLSFVFFLFFVMGMLDLGRLYFQFVALEDAAGEAALYLALNLHCPSTDATECSTFFGKLPPELKPEGTYSCSSCGDNNARTRANKASSLIDLDLITNPNSKLEFDFIPYSGGDAENMVKVKISYPFKLLTPVISDIVGSNTVMLTAEASQVVLDT